MRNFSDHTPHDMAELSDRYHSLMEPKPGPGYEQIKTGFSHDTHPAVDGSVDLAVEAAPTENWDDQVARAKGRVAQKVYEASRSEAAPFGSSHPIEQIVQDMLRHGTGVVYRVPPAEFSLKPGAVNTSATPGFNRYTGEPNEEPAGMDAMSAQERKNSPVATGVLDYFPDAILAVAALSKIGNDQHNLGMPMRWDRSKSGDERDAAVRHLMQAGTIDSDGVRHSAKAAWRALSNLQKEIEEQDGAPLPRGAVLSHQK